MGPVGEGTFEGYFDTRVQVELEGYGLNESNSIAILWDGVRCGDATDADLAFFFGWTANPVPANYDGTKYDLGRAVDGYVSGKVVMTVCWGHDARGDAAKHNVEVGRLTLIPAQFRSDITLRGPRALK